MSFELQLLPSQIDFETKAFLKKAAGAHRYLTELKWISGTNISNALRITQSSAGSESCFTGSTNKNLGDVNFDNAIGILESLLIAKYTNYILENFKL